MLIIGGKIGDDKNKSKNHGNFSFMLWFYISRMWETGY